MTFWLRRCSEQSRRPKEHHAPGAVAEDLDLDVAGRVDQLLEVEARVLEVHAGEALDGGVGLFESVGVGAAAHSDAAATGRALQHHRVADLACGAPPFGHSGQKTGPGQQRQAGLRGQGACGVLETEGAESDPPSGR